VAAIVFHSLALAEGFADVDATQAIDVERDRVREIRLGGHELPLQALRNLEPGQRPLRLVRRLGDDGLLRRRRKVFRTDGDSETEDKRSDQQCDAHEVR
jgi:hypothetical protein